MKKQMLVVAMAVALLVGCGKTLKEKKAVDLQQTSNQTTMGWVSDTRENPYDSFGIRHNQVLEALRAHRKQTGDTTRPGRIAFFTEELERRGCRMPNVNLDKVELLYRQVQEIGLEKFLDQTTISEPVKQYLLRLEAIIANTTSPDLFPNFLEEIRTLEQEVLNSDLSEPDKEGILTVSSITYHSGSYWKKVYDDDSWITPSFETSAARWWHWPIAANADNVGGVFGLLLGFNRDDIAATAEWMSGCAEGFLDVYL